MAPPDPILGIKTAHDKDSNPNKINLGIGAYRDGDGKPYVFKSVEKVERELISKKMNHEYLGMEGDPSFVTGARNLIFGKDHQVNKEGRVASVQVLSGTGGVYLGMDFLSKYMQRLVYISNPTWPNHKSICEKLGLKFKEYPYFDAKTKGFDFEGTIKALKNAVPGSIVLLHPCAHNPTGVDPTEEQWRAIAEVMKKNSLFPFFDSAYQGYASGDLDKDAYAIRYFADQGFQMIITQSFAKNMGLYGERVGALHFVASNKDTAVKCGSELKVYIRRIYSNPPRFGATVAGIILNNKQYYDEWKNELKDVVAQRIIDMRSLLRNELEKIGTPGKWNHITDQIGMFSYTGLSPKACELLSNKYHVYLMKTGRISMAGVNPKNVGYLAQSIKNSIQESS